MTCYQRFADLPTAQAAFAAGACRRHVEIDGHVIDLLQAAREEGRVREEPMFIGGVPVFAVADGALPSGCDVMMLMQPSREVHDAIVAASLAHYFARRDQIEAVPDLPELAAPEVPARVERCPWCNGEVGQ